MQSVRARGRGCVYGRERERQRETRRGCVRARERVAEIKREKEREVALVRRSPPGMGSVECGARPVRPALSARRESPFSPCERRQDSQQETRRDAHEGYVKTLRHRPLSEVTAPPDQ